jgi:hypothetical protein
MPRNEATMPKTINIIARTQKNTTRVGRNFMGFPANLSSSRQTDRDKGRLMDTGRDQVKSSSESGHTFLVINILPRYLKQTNLDTEEAQRRAGPVDNAGL